MTKPFLLGVDQGSSGSKAVIIDCEGQVCGYAYRPLERLYSRPGWVEQDPDAVARGVEQAITAALAAGGISANEIAACGLTGQRNTEFVWDGRSGAPLSNAITWQDLRTLPLLEEFKQWPQAGEARRRLGYAPGAYMAALHLAWRMREDTAVIRAAREGHLRLGLSTAWLLTALGKPAAHLMDHSMTQATGLYDFRAGEYWPAWLEWVGVPAAALPAATSTVHDYGTLMVRDGDGRETAVPVRAMIGDQQAALFGHGCRQPGAAECTHGTASYVKVFLGNKAPLQEKVNVYHAWDLGKGQTYCLEAATSVTGAAIRWLRDNAKLFAAYEELNQLAAMAPHSDGVTFVPAFTGLEMPHNMPQARATLLGLTLGHHRGHIARAMLEAIGYQMRLILDVMAAETGVTVTDLLVGGGVSASDLACQIQADVTGLPVLRPTFAETTAWAAAALAGWGAGFWTSETELPPLPGTYVVFRPTWEEERREEGYGRFRGAIELVASWGAIREPATPRSPQKSPGLNNTGA